MHGRRVVRVFISSPSDVDRERRAAAAVVRRLDREFRRFFSVEPFLWEHERQLASSHSQDAVDPTEFDIVVLILWSRLGTPLPERTAKREYRGVDGRTPVTGTEWEYEHARAHAEATGAPALLVFRNHSPAPFSTTDLTLRAQQDAQLRALDRFWERHFRDRGVFLTAFTGYTRLAEFEEKLTEQLREVLEDFIRRGWSPAAAPAITWFESPFRGLEAYDFRHAPIFYGRDAATRQAVEQLAANAAAGTAFLVVLGASGSGKSSLVRAGVLPDLAVANAISGVRAWRRVLFRPSASPDDLFTGVARQIAQANPEDPGAGLAEIVSDYFPLEQLARHLRDNATAPAAPIQLALAQVAAKLKDSDELHPGEQVRLIVVIDQLEELFTEPAITAVERERFILMLASLARSGSVWVIATMRSDFWHRVAELPLLAELANGEGRLDLWPPNTAELTEIIRQPAAAAGLSFETDERRIGLDTQIAADAASAPGVLPLLSYTLEALYKRDVEQAGGKVLRWESYRAIGGLHGAIARRADDMVEELRRDGVDDQVVARVLRRLVSLDESAGNRIVARTAALADLAAGTPERRLIDAFLRPDMRLLVAEGDIAKARVRVAHEALLTEWERARRLLAEDAVNLARRRRLEEAERRWHNAAPADRPGLLLRAGLELNEAEALAAAWAGEIEPALLDYIEESRQAERRRIEEREETARRLADRLAEARLNESRFLASFAEVELRDDNIQRASLIALEALPSDMRKPDRPIWNGALMPIAKARARDRALAVAVGHTDWVRSAAFSPDGQRIVTASHDHTGRLWDAASGAALGTLEGHTGWVESVAFSPDGQRILTASRDGTARLWDAASGTALATLEGHTDWVESAAFSPDGQRILTASRDNTARLWDGKTGAVLAILEGHEGALWSAAYSPDGTCVITGSFDHTARLWDAASGAALATLEGHTDGVTSAAVSPDGERVVTASRDGTARLWDAADGKLLATLEGHTDAVNSAAFSRDGERVVTTSADKTARLWDPASGAALATLRGHTGWVMSAAFSPDGQRIVTASLENTALLWDAASGALLATIEGHMGYVESAAFSPDGERIVTASADNTARVWDAASGAACVILEGHKGRVGSATFSPDGERVVTASRDETARLWDAASGAALATLEGHAGGVGSVAFGPDGGRVITAPEDDITARLWDGAGGAMLATLEGHTSVVLSAAFSPDGQRIVTASADHTARLWDAASGAALATLEGHTDVVASAVFSPDGAQVVTASRDNTVRLWDAASGAALGTLEGHTGWVESVAFSPDGQHVVTASHDHTARLWDAASGAALATLEGHRDWVMSGAFSPDGQRIVTASHDHTGRLWDAASGAACAILESHADAVNSAAFSPDGARIVTASSDHTARVWDTASGATLATLEGHTDAVVCAAFSPGGEWIVTASGDNTARLWPVWP